MTPIKYNDAADLLGVDVGTLRHAVTRGALTRLPRRGQIQPIIREQAMLFKGKRLSLNSLNESARAEWERLAHLANGDSSSLLAEKESNRAPAAPERVGASITMPMFNLDRSALEYLSQHNLSVRAETPIGLAGFHSALADETDREDASGSAGLVLLLAILLGLVILLKFIPTKEKKESKREATQTIAQIGLEKEDLIMNQREAIAALRSHPVEVAQLRSILTREDLLTLE